MPKVSVVIPTYNRDSFIAGTIESVLNQSYRDYEIIVVDDGSIDETRKSVKSFGSHVRYIYQKNRGASSARNTGILHAKGEFIAFLDSDDLFLPNKLEIQMNYLNSHPDCKFLYSWYYKAYPNGEIKMLRKNIAPRNQEHLKFCLIKRRLGIRTSTVIVHRACFNKDRLFNEKYWRSEDWDMWLRLAAEFPTACIEVPLTKYIIHDSNISKKQNALFRQQIINSAMKLYGWNRNTLELLEQRYGNERDCKQS